MNNSSWQFATGGLSNLQTTVSDIKVYERSASGFKLMCTRTGGNTVALSTADVHLIFIGY